MILFGRMICEVMILFGRTIYKSYYFGFGERHVKLWFCWENDMWSNDFVWENNMHNLWFGIGKMTIWSYDLI